MIYTEETRKKLESILKAFEKYIDSQDYFDILYSKKVGYLWVVVNPPGGAGAEQLDTPKRMLDVIFNEVINDVINSPENRSHIPEARTLTGWEEAESRRQLTAILEQIESRTDEYLEYLDEFLQDYQECYSAKNGFDKII